jgi:hypothetical protein
MVIVNSSIEHDAHAEGVVNERLMGPIAQVHDAEPAMPEATPAQAENAFAVGAAARLRLGHFRDCSNVGKFLIET